jgi:hypothetical protein
MDERYKEWIALNVPSYPVGMCKAISTSMHEEFPELRLVRGHYSADFFDGDGAKEWPHWWLEDAKGVVIDPTVAQWPDKGIHGIYVEHTGPEPTGRCVNCGGYCYGPDPILCSETCDAEYRAYLIADIQRELGGMV